MADIVNPYAPDRSQQLAMLLMSLGGGISQAGAANRPAWEGIAPGASMFSTSLMQSQQLGQQRALQEEAAQLRRRQMGLQEQELSDKRAQRDLQIKGMGAWADANDPTKTAMASVPGMAPPPVQPRMGPQDYDTRTASLEGGSKNGGFVFNELGSGAFGPYQFMPGTWADVRAKNPDLNLPADMTQANGDQHKAAFDSFSKGNAAILQQAGIQPTPENLYLAHRFGAGGATTMLRADPNAMLADVLPVDWQKQNPDMRGQTVGGFRRLAAERMKGVGVPYQASGEQTSMALQPASLPAFGGTGMADFQPGATPLPQLTGRAVATNFRPGGPQMAQAPQNIPQGDSVTVQPSMVAPPPAPPEVPRPTQLPPSVASYLSNAVRSGAMTPKEGEAAKQKHLDDMWTAAKDTAKAGWTQQNENYRFERGEASKAEQWYTLGKDDVSMMPGLDPGKSYQRNRRTGEVKPIGQPLVSIDQKGETAFTKQVAEQDAKRLGTIQDNTQSVLDTVSKIRSATDLLSQTYTGPNADYANAWYRALGTLGVESAKNKGDAATAAQALISEMTPRMRPAGSGSTSDMEMRTFGQALPNMLNTPGGNALVAQYWERIADRAVAIQTLAEKHAAESKGLTGTKFAEEVKALGPLFTKDELTAMQAAGKAKAAPATAERPPLETFSSGKAYTPMPQQQKPPLASFGGAR